MAKVQRSAGRLVALQKARMKEMLKISGRKEPNMVSQLLSCLPQEARQLITGMSSEEQAWEELDAK